ncbi:MAG: DEAD/DEAH box helicase [Myxococcales bacterium]
MSGLDLFHSPTQAWFSATFAEPTQPQKLGWPAMARGDSTLLLAPTGTGKTLAAFLGALDQLMFEPVPAKRERCRVLYVSPLKALAVDIERNLRAPLVGIARAAEAEGVACHIPMVMVRTGDTPANERARFQRAPADILVTTPESLYLLLTSRAREVLASVRTVIIDEIHALVPTKRGSHLALSVERLEELTGRRLQRIGLSATQRPLEEVARFLGGAETSAAPKPKKSKQPAAGEQVHDEFAEPAVKARYRPVTVVDAGAKKTLELKIEVPVEDMARLGEPIPNPSGNAAQGTVRSSIWTAIHPRLLDLVKAHRSTILFVNARRVAERLAGAINELAGETLVQAHHGSVARLQRLEIEDKLKAGQLRGLVATSSLELGIDMGAVDLVVQIEAPPSVASGLQRIGRAGHQVGAPSKGILFPKWRGDLVACAALTEAMRQSDVEPIRYPRNPLDVLAQQIVAMAAMDVVDADEAFALARRAAPYAELSRRAFDGVLDMLSGRYSSDDFAELKPRLTWDRLKGTLKAREGARQVAITNGGTIPDRGLYGVYLAGAPKGSNRVGELDEEMVFESRVGETFVLGATTWRIEEITHDRVLVVPAPGVPGRMPFWKGDNVGRPLEVGQRIGKLTRELAGMPKAAGLARLTRAHDLDDLAAENLLRYLEDQKAAIGVIPDDRTVVIERTRDELSDWRVCVLSPFGGRVHAPWAMAATARIRRERGLEVETMWTDDGFVVRFPDTEKPPDASLFVPEPEELEADLWSELGGTALFAARFRENAARALLLPKRRPGARMPLWQTRKRAHDLLSVASRYPSFPVILETYRECLRDVFDVPALTETVRRVRGRQIKVVTKDSQVASPFASAILFGFVANYLYDGDAPLAERRAQALAIDHAQLRELLGDVALRELLDPDAVEAVGRQLQRLEPHLKARSVDSLHDLLIRLGDLTREEIGERARGRSGRTGCRSLGGTPRRAGGDRRTAALRGGGGRRPLPRRPGDRASRRSAGGAPGTRGSTPARPGAPLRPDASAIHRRGAGPPLRARTPRGGGDAGEGGGGRAPARRRVPAGRHGPGVVRSGGPAADSPALAGEPARGGRAGRAARPVADALVLAGRHQAAARDGRAPGHHRAAPGRGASGLGVRAGDPGGAGRGLQPARPGRAGGRWRGGLGGRRAAGRARRAHRPVPHRPPAPAVAPLAGSERRAGGARAGAGGGPARARRDVLRGRPRRGGGRLPGPDAGVAVGPRLQGVGDQRPAPAAARLHAAQGCARPPQLAGPGLVPLAPRGAAFRRGPLVAGRVPRGEVPDLRHRVRRSARAAAARSIRAGDPGGAALGVGHRRVQRGLRRVQGDGGGRAHPPRLLRQRGRRPAVRAAAGGRSPAGTP